MNPLIFNLPWDLGRRGPCSQCETLFITLGLWLASQGNRGGLADCSPPPTRPYLNFGVLYISPCTQRHARTHEIVAFMKNESEAMDPTGCL